MMKTVDFRSLSTIEKNDVLHDELPGYAYIGRPSIYGNPFQIGRDGSREEVIEKYRKWFFSRSQEFRDKAFKDLAGKHLVCWCAPKPCHGDVLLKFIEDELKKGA